jgi:hypothetical protein
MATPSQFEIGAVDCGVTAASIMDALNSDDFDAWWEGPAPFGRQSVCDYFHGRLGLYECVAAAAFALQRVLRMEGKTWAEHYDFYATTDAVAAFIRDELHACLTPAEIRPLLQTVPVPELPTAPTTAPTTPNTEPNE